MGSARKPKPRGQPHRANPPATSTASSGVDLSLGSQPKTLRISLVRVDRAVTTSVSAGDAVNIRESNAGYSAYVARRRLGDVPPRFHASLDDGYRSGFIERISPEPLRLIVKLLR
jgi:hypothetical protein